MRGTWGFIASVSLALMCNGTGALRDGKEGCGDFDRTWRLQRPSAAEDLICVNHGSDAQQYEALIRHAVASVVLFVRQGEQGCCHEHHAP